MKVALIVGASGLVGGYLFKEFRKKYKVIGTYYKHPHKELIFLNLCSKQSIKKVINKFKPEIVLIPAFDPNVDYCELYPKESRKVNVGGLNNLLEILSKIKKSPYLIYFSSDYVFDGNNGPYNENDLPNPINEYGRQKIICEELVKKYTGKFLIIRTTGVYGWQYVAKNFVSDLVQRAKKNNPRKVSMDQIGNPTYAGNLAEITLDLTTKKITGIVNVAGNDLYNRYEFAKKIVCIFKLPEKIIIPVTTKELFQSAKRPIKGGLIIKKLENLTDVPILGVKKGLKRMLKEK